MNFEYKLYVLKFFKNRNLVLFQHKKVDSYFISGNIIFNYIGKKLLENNIFSLVEENNFHKLYKLKSFGLEELTFILQNK